MQINRTTSVAFSGYRTSKLEKSFSTTDELEQLKQEIFSSIFALCNQGFDTFICGMSEGFDLICGEIVLNIISMGHPIKLIAAVPFKGHETNAKNRNSLIYNRILKESSQTIYLSDKFSGTFQYLQRNDFMLENCSLLLCYFDGQSGGTKYTYKKAEKLGIKIINLSKKLPQQLSLLR